MYRIANSFKYKPRRGYKMKLRPHEVQKFCQVSPIDMLLGTGHCDHGEDCATCQYLKVDLYLNYNKSVEPDR